ncbi:MAG: hypothetical protein B7Z71_01005 [Acidocella sp. 21-58-7]|nr:MAG: hypothetical protein B7Z71_01005 [Acidocella sp. 21-58-7]
MHPSPDPGLMTRPKYRYALVACARWETRYITEWLTYYSALGYDHVYLYCNDDDPVELYRQVLPFVTGALPFVTFRHYPQQGAQPQMYADFLARNRADCEWVSFLDVDEFLRLPPGQSIGDFMARFSPDIDCVMFNLIYFGPNGHKTPPDGPVLETLTAREADIHCLTKYCARAACLTSPKFFDFSEEHWYWHTLHYITNIALKTVNALGETMDGYYDGFPDRPTQFVNEPARKQALFSTAIIHHYAFRSEAHFMQRYERGIEGSFRRQSMWKDVYEGDGFAAFLAKVNAVQDTSLANFWPELSKNGWPDSPQAMPRFKIACVAVVKDEAHHIAEWIAYQFAVGFDSVILFDNGSTDATAAIALKFAAKHDIRVLNSRYTGEDYQKSTYRDALQRFGAEFTWMAFFDADEFLVFTPPNSLRACLATHTKTAAIAVNWAIFGSSGQRERPDGLTIATYTHRGEPAFGPNKHVKSIVRPEYVQGILNGHSFQVNGPYRNLSGEEISWDSPGIIADLPDYQTGKLHHYFTRSWADWQAKIQRGYPDLQRNLSDFDIYDRNEIADGSAWTLAPMVQRLIDESKIFDRPAQQAYRNIARGQPATQSSVCEWSYGPTVEQDAAGAVNGRVDGTRKFHTGFEANPWWQVDLGQPTTIRQIKIFNTTEETAFRFRNFSLGVSIDGEFWAEIVRKEDDVTVGGYDTAPFIWESAAPAWGRYVRITALGENCYLHLDQVEIYGNDERPIAETTDGDTTVVITSCNRHDLLEKTLASFRAYNSYPGIKDIIVVEDGEADPSAICALYGAKLIRLNARKGQLYAIDTAYSHVTTPYIFHCEDDWEFYRGGFIERSRAILEQDPSCICVWLRAWSDTNGHPLSFRSRDKTFGVLAFDYSETWHGFTFNPSLRRKSDYDIVGPFSKEFNQRADLAEPALSGLYRHLGFRAVILDETGYVQHTGWHRHVGS